MSAHDSFVAIRKSLHAPGARFLIYLALSVLLLESSFRVGRSLLFESTHLALFKPALARLHPDIDAYVLGSSRLERAVLPGVFDATLSQMGIKRRTFGIAIADTSLAILSYTCAQAAQREGLRAAIVEVSAPQVVDRPADWETDSGNDARDGAERHLQQAAIGFSDLLRLRAALRFDSLTRLVAASAFSRAFDGSEHYGTDYVRSVLGRRRSAEVQPVEWQPQLVLTKVVSVPKRYEKALSVYRQCANALTKQGTAVSFVVPPVGPHYAGEEQEPDFALLLQAVASLGPVLDFHETAVSSDYWVDNHHMNALGATQFSRRLAQLHAQLPGWQNTDALQ